jgi:hypothetical protein
LDDFELEETVSPANFAMKIVEPPESAAVAE